MDRTLKVYAKTGHLFAEFEFYYEHHNQAKGRYTPYRRLYNDDEEDENKSVYPSYEQEFYPQFRKFSSIDEIKKHDIDIVKKELGRDMTDGRGYDYVYDIDQVLHRYVAENHRGTIGMVNIYFNFIENKKEVKFLSATNPRFDFDISSDSLETNIECIARIPVYQEREEPRDLSPYDCRKLPAWY
jgi:hypothetical protein